MLSLAIAPPLWLLVPTQMRMAMAFFVQPNFNRESPPLLGTLTSALTDCRKLGESSLGPRKVILIFGYEYEAWPMEPTIAAFEAIAARDARLGDRVSAPVENLVHPVHQRVAVFGWEILEVTP